MKVVFITGASSGIGKAIGEFLHEKKFKVYGTSRNVADKKSVFELLEMDVKKPESISNCVAKIIEKEGRLDVLINNAGVGITGAVEEIPMNEIKNHFDVNFFGPIAVMQAVLPQMRQQKAGLIINITSIAGYMGLPYRGIYSASKSALEILTEATRMEVKKLGINITNVAPGDFATNIAAGRYHAPIIQNSDYEKDYANVLKMMNEHVNSGGNPQQMAEAIFKIINAKNIIIHYKVGDFMQKFSIVLKRILPDLVYEKMLMKHFGM
jgi:short-subunit dehydrogenase